MVLKPDEKRNGSARSTSGHSIAREKCVSASRRSGAPVTWLSSHPLRRSLHPPGSRLTADLTVIEEDHTGEQESFSPGQQNLPAQNEDKLLLPEILETPSNDDCQSFLHAPSPGRSDEQASLAPGQEDMRLSTSPCTEGSSFLLYERLERHRRLSETLSASLPASPSSAAGSDVHFAFSPQTSQLPEPAVWKSPASSNTTPLADIAFVCYEDLSSPEEVTSPGVVAVAKGSPSGQASPKVPKHTLVTPTKNPRYKFFTSKNARADETPGASKQTTVLPGQPFTDKAEPAPEASRSGRVSTSRTSERSKTPFWLQSRAATSDQEKSAEKPDEVAAQVCSACTSGSLVAQAVPDTNPLCSELLPDLELDELAHLVDPKDTVEVIPIFREVFPPWLPGLPSTLVAT
ncbi:uncharacterized protein ISCGN_016139 [Ixodes scapularis]